MTHKIIHVTASAGPALAICPYCKQVTGDTTLLMPMPFYEQLGDKIHREPVILHLSFQPVQHCNCKTQQQPS